MNNAEGISANQAMSEPQKQTAVIVGASAKPSRYSYRSLIAHRDCGYEVYPVNPRGGEIEGLRVYSSISEVPSGPFDRVTMYVGPEVGLGLLEAIAEKGCTELWLNPGTESPEVVAKAKDLGLNPIVACSLVDCASR